MKRIIPHVIGDKEPDADLILLLVNMLDRARKGEIVALAATVIYEDLNKEDHWNFDNDFGTLLVGNLHLMTRDLENEILSDGGDEDDE